MSTAEEQESAVVTGQVTGVLAKGNDKWQILVQPQGSQYTKNLWTKDYGLVQQMEGSINSWFSFVCGVSNWTNQQGQPVKSLWVNSITAPGQAEQPQGQPQGQPQQQPAQGQPGLSPMEKEERIMREHAMGVVALMLPYMQVADRHAGAMVGVAEGLISYYKLGPSAFNGQGQPQTSANTPSAYEEAPPLPDEPPPDEYGDQAPWQ